MKFVNRLHSNPAFIDVILGALSELCASQPGHNTIVEFTTDQVIIKRVQEESFHQRYCAIIWFDLSNFATTPRTGEKKMAELESTVHVALYDSDRSVQNSELEIKDFYYHPTKSVGAMTTFHPEIIRQDEHTIARQLFNFIMKGQWPEQ